jgi:peptidoglycan hydrolase CwlO-like protein
MLPRLFTMFKFLFRIALFSALFFYFLTLSIPANAGCSDYFSCTKEIERVKKEIARLNGLEDSLANQISYLDNQIYLSELEIKAKGQEIVVLSVDIGDLSTRLERIGNFLDYQEEVFVNRARLAYASDQLSSFDIVLGAENLDDALRRIKYLHVLEDQDIQSLSDLRDTRTSFNDQKKELENKKSSVEQLKREVEDQKSNLISQQNSKEQLLAETQGKEERYRDLLKQLEEERAEILAALRSKGYRLGPVKKGDPIAIQGSTGCSTGNHIHYSVYYDSNPSKEGVGYLTEVNPCSYVRVRGGTCNSGRYPLYYPNGRVYSGSFRAPGSEGSLLTQSYWTYHRALDLVSGDGTVYASANGVASIVTDGPSYGAICRSRGIPYNGLGYGIRVDQGSIVTSYWHIKKPPGF